MINDNAEIICYFNVILDAYSFVICLILFCSVFLSRRSDTKLGKCFLLLCLFNMGMLMGDIPNWMCEGKSQIWNPILLKMGTVLYFISSGPLLLSFTGYIMECVRPKVSAWVGYWRIAAAFCALQAVFSLLSLHNGMYYMITEENIYERGSWFWLSQLIPFLMYVTDSIMIVVYRKALGKKTCFFLSSYIFLPAAAEVIQIFHYGFSPLNTAVTASVFLIFIHIQLERDHLMELQKKELASAQSDILLSQIQPHFLYNTLSVIRHLCVSSPGQAGQAITDLSLFLRSNMQSLKSRRPVPFVQEMKHVELYLNIEKLRFHDRINIRYEIEEAQFYIPSLTLQPIVENAVHHGILKRMEGGMITISAKAGESAYVVTVADNGPGCVSPQRRDNKSKQEGYHIGIENVRERLAFMVNGTLEIQSNVSEGTKAVITIPKKNKLYGGKK